MPAKPWRLPPRNTRRPPTSDEETEPSTPSVVSEPPGDVNAALLLHEAAAVLNLHAQAVAVQNIRSLVPIVLDVNSGNYTRWREQFLFTLGKYSLQNHVLHDFSAPDSPDWSRMDCVVLSCLYGTIANDLVDVVLECRERGATARATWLAIESQFLGNRETRPLPRRPVPQHRAG